MTCPDPRLRATIRGLGLGYVMQVAANRRMPTGIGPRRVDELAANLPASAWERRSVGPRSKGPRFYSWAWLTLEPETDPDTGSRTPSSPSPPRLNATTRRPRPDSSS
ncbi:hypothetical protein [uncultured Jatrophihabitans sp.]|uniref:hypothetical protein n=1 Tax=uncultured Jatrophihabitans sp. TaxID=1610747 RepID=UPI0035CA9B72